MTGRRVGLAMGLAMGLATVFAFAGLSVAQADWRAYTDDNGAPTISTLDIEGSVALSVNCAQAVTLVTQSPFAPGDVGLNGRYDNGLAFVVEARVPTAATNAVELVRPDQQAALVRGLTNRHQLVLVDPSGTSHTFDLAGFGALWREACQLGATE